MRVAWEIAVASVIGLLVNELHAILKVEGRAKLMGDGIAIREDLEVQGASQDACEVDHVS